MAGIDAPELGQPFGRHAKEGLSNIAYRHQVVVEWSKQNRYGRIVGKVLVEGRDADLEQVKAGLAWHYVAYARELSPADRQAYATAESQAREHRLGLWLDPEPAVPWDYRRAKRLVTHLGE